MVLCPSCTQLSTVLDDKTHDGALAFKELSDKLKKTRGISVAHLNINGLLTKIHQIRLLLEETRLDILTISESHLNSEIINEEIEIENYSILRKDRKDDSSWGGVLIYFRDSLNGIEYTKMNVLDLETILLECSFKSQKLLASCIYQPPRDLNKFLSKFETVLTNLPIKRCNMLILGDFNIDMSSENSSTGNICTKFKDLLKRFNLCSIITEPTRITDSSKTQIDHIIIPKTFNSKVKTSGRL